MKHAMMYKLVPLFVVSMIWSSHGAAHAWVANAPVWSQSYGTAQVPGDSETDDSGVTFGQSTATATANNGMASAFAHGNSRGLWGANVITTASGSGALAGIENPFVDPIVALLGDGMAELDYDANYLETGTLELVGTADWNANGYLELAVLNIIGLTEAFVADIFLIYGSVESALFAGYITNSMVLFSERESGLSNSFSYNIDIGSLGEDNILISAVSHSVAFPEPSVVLLFGLGVIGLVVSRKYTKKKSVFTDC